MQYKFKKMNLVLFCCVSLLTASASAKDQQAITTPTAKVEVECPASGCTAEPIYANGRYIGCFTCVNGHGSLSDTKGLTELGCRTYCDDLKNEAKILLESLAND